MATLEEAFAYYRDVMGRDPEWLSEISYHLKDDYEQLLASKELFGSQTVKNIFSTFNDHGEWEMIECMNCISQCHTDWNHDGVGYLLEDLYRSNGTKENKNFRISAILWKGHSGRTLSHAKIPHDASARVIKNRFEKMKKEIEEKMA